MSIQDSFSKDTLSNVLVDKIIAPNPQDNVQVRKEKIVFGADGSYTDVTVATPFPVQGTFSFSDPSVGLNGSTAPTSSTQAGAKDTNGNLQALKVDSNGALVVNTSGSFSIQALKVLFNEVSAVSVGLETLINTYTAPVGKIAYLLTILNSGGNRATFQIYNNGTLFDKQYTNVTNQTALFDYKTGSSSVPGMVIPVGNTITVTTINSGTTVESYNSRFMILEVT